ncbi:methionyl-tRNA formyltransferase [Micavibrio aeruginosavorus]|uniref:methionyl-tRNA formyltransferase n=1 Tax=Micavibrio aeruginosavorus TaxID=349221 RepID=UPI003F4AA789
MNNGEGLKVVFMGTPDFSVPALKAILNSHHTVVAVYSQPPRPKGRGQQVQPSPVHAAALDAGIPVYNPLSLKKDEAARAQFKALGADVAVVAAYGLILPLDVLDAPKYGCINIHASLLPRWRGASPIQRAIWAGDDATGISIMQMGEGLDTGPVIAMRDMKLNGKTTTPELHDALSIMGADMIVPVLDRLAIDGRIDVTPQDDAQSTYAPMLKKDDGRVDWTKTAAEIDQQIRALNPWPGVWTANGDARRIKIVHAQLEDMRSHDPAGTLMDRDGRMVCGDGRVLRLMQVHPENGKVMDSFAAINGGILTVGTVLGD